ncbi:GNAT family N-acetyltransferase [Microbacterium hydrocarbonoxydans]|uniref:GNAT family N-acetyltransferase n=1 Tax=Microbacterium hydrocarbonoxydans TaxID=273678 RepID=UPI00203BB688|nr:GNAT family N-acetyltransferase [Microbacterium hydrocarbonoxydans]MCM3781288.1 GNAT family N-acetyltransferase [Microbacterium hydrocarbonoxydans]
MALTLTPLDPDRFDDWRSATRLRLIALRQDSGLLVGDDAVAHADAFLDQLLPDGAETQTSVILSIRDGGPELGTVWLASISGILMILDLSFAGRPTVSQEDELFTALVEMGRAHGVDRLSISVYATDAASRSFIDDRGFACASIQMLLEPLPDRERAPVVKVEPMTAERYPSFVAASEAAFAEELAASGRYSIDDARAESHRQMVEELPDGVETVGQQLFTATVDGEEVGILWVGLRSRGDRPHAFILDIEVAESQRRKGYGRELMRAAEQVAREHGADSVGLHVFGANEGAIALYEGLGYRRVEERHLLHIAE